MKIICIAASQVPSDTANSIQVMKVCQAFAQLGHDVRLLVPEAPDREIDLQEHYGLTKSFPVEWLQSGSRRFFPWKATRRAHALGADLIYCWPLQSAVLGLMSGMPVAVELHDLPGGRFGRLWFNLLLAIPGRKRLLPITRALMLTLRLPEDLTCLAPDGVDLERYADLPAPQEARKVLGLPDALTVLCTGHLYEGRGVDLFLKLAERLPDASFVWVGGRPVDVAAWKQKASHLRNVTLTGFVPNERIPVYQAAADVLLMPYGNVIATSSGGNTAEVCSPMKMFEYMAAGRAILASDLPVLHEVLDDSMAYFIPPGEINAWEQALNTLLSDEGKRQDLARHARAAVEPYSWVERARQTLEGIVV